MYFKAYIYLTQIHGVSGEMLHEQELEAIQAPTLAKLKEKISKRYFDLDKPIGADVQIFDNRIEISYEGEHDYRTSKKDQFLFFETVSIYIAQVEETEVNLASEKLFSKIPRS